MAGAIAIKSVDQLDEICEYIRDVAPTEVFVDIFKIGCNLALRISDLMKLRYSDFMGRDVIDVKMQKTKKYIQIAITPTVRDLIEARRARNPDDEYLFESDYPRYKGKPLSIRRVQQVFHDVAVYELQGAKFSTHTMRKSLARIMWENDVPLELISEMLGHSSVEVTKRYLGITQSEVDGIRQAVQLQFGNK